MKEYIVGGYILEVETNKNRVLRGSKMFKWLSCEHSYQFYNTKIDYDCMGYGYYSFEFVCPKCKKRNKC